MKSKTMLTNGHKKVLIVDDEDDVRDIISEIISDMGFSVFGAKSGEAALNMMSQTPVDLVISDVKMNGMDGLSLARRLRSRFPKLSLALMTSQPTDDVHRMLQEKQVDFLLLKPFQIDELQGMVQDLTG